MLETRRSRIWLRCLQPKSNPQRFVPPGREYDFHRFPELRVDRDHGIWRRFPGGQIYLVPSAARTRAHKNLLAVRVSAAFQSRQHHAFKNGAGICVSAHPLIKAASREYFLRGRSVSGAVDHARCINQTQSEPELLVQPEDPIGGLIRQDGRPSMLCQPFP